MAALFSCQELFLPAICPMRSQQTRPRYKDHSSWLMAYIPMFQLYAISYQPYAISVRFNSAIFCI
jgi:hypothetical protein